MPRGKKYGPEEIIPNRRETEVLMFQGTTQELAAKQIGKQIAYRSHFNIRVILKAEPGSELADPISHDTDSDLAVRYGLPGFLR